MRTASLSAVSLILALATGCFGGGGADAPSAPDIGEAPPDVGRMGAQPKKRRVLGRDALRGVVDKEGEHVVLATCRGERVLLFDRDDQPYAAEDALPAMVAYDVERVAIGVPEFALGVDGGARVQGMLDRREFREGDCDIQPATVPPDRVAIPSARIAERRKRAVRLQVTLPAGEVSSPPLTERESYMRELSGITHAMCEELPEVHRVFWEVESAEGAFLGGWFLPCVIANRNLVRGGEGPVGEWTLTEEGSEPMSLSGPVPALDTLTRLLGFRSSVSNMRINCDKDGRCPPELQADGDGGKRAKELMTIPGHE